MASKRKRLEGFTQASLKTSNKKVEEVWKTQQEERSVILQHLLDSNNLHSMLDCNYTYIQTKGLWFMYEYYICMLYSIQGILHLLFIIHFIMKLCVTYGSLPFPMSPTCTSHSPSLSHSILHTGSNLVQSTRNRSRGYSHSGRWTWRRAKSWRKSCTRC